MADLTNALIGAALRERREAIGMSQTVLANAIKLSRTSVTNIERGRQPMSIHHLYMAADALGISARNLLPEIQLTAKKSKGRSAPDVPALLRMLASESAGAAE